MLLIVAVIAVVAAIFSIRDLPATAPPAWRSGPVGISRMVPVGGKRVRFSGYLQFDIEGRFYLTHMSVSLRQLAITVDNVPVSDTAAYRRELGEVVWWYFDGPETLPMPSGLGPMINEAIEAPGTVVSRDFAEAKHAELSLMRGLWSVVIGTVVLLCAGAWLSAVVFSKRGGRR